MRALRHVIGILFGGALLVLLLMAFSEEDFPELVPGKELSDFFNQVQWLAIGGFAVVALIAFVVVGRQEGSR